MNFLQLVQRTARECGLSGQPTTTVSQTGEAGRIVDWVNEAWMDIQLSHQDWDWMRKSASVNTVDGQYLYDPVADWLLTDFGAWDEQTFRNYVTATGVISEVPMSVRDYDEWRDLFLFGGNRNTRARPMEFAVAPFNHQIALGPVPAAGYTVTADYFSVPSLMSADTDIPALPSQYHMAIVYGAMQRYGMYEVAQEVINRGQSELSKMMSRIENDRLPMMHAGGSLA